MNRSRSGVWRRETGWAGAMPPAVRVRSRRCSVQKRETAAVMAACSSGQIDRACDSAGRNLAITAINCW